MSGAMDDSDHPAVRAAKRAVAGCGDPSRGMQEIADRRKMPRVPLDVAQLHAEIHPLHIPDAVRLAAGGLWPPLNPSITRHRGELLACVRMHEPNSESSLRRSVNVLARVTPGWALADARPVRYLPAPEEPLYFEDVRLVSLGDRLVGCASACDRVSPPQFTVLDFDDAGDITAAHVQRSPGMQKNWMPVTLGGAMGFVYSTDPVIVVGYDSAAGVCVPAAADLPPLAPRSPRGGSQLVLLEDGSWLAVVHQLFSRPPFTHESLVYLHQFARFSPDLRTVALGPLWHLGRVGIEYVAGMVSHEGGVVLSFGRRDREALLAVVYAEALAGVMPRWA